MHVDIDDYIFLVWYDDLWNLPDRVIKCDYVLWWLVLYIFVAFPG